MTKKLHNLAESDTLVRDLLKVNQKYIKTFDPDHPYGDNIDYVQMFMVLKVLALRTPGVAQYIDEQIQYMQQRLTKHKTKNKKQTHLSTVRQS